MSEYIIEDGHLDKFDLPVKDCGMEHWKPVPDCPSTIDPNVTKEQIEQCLAKYIENQHKRILTEFNLSEEEFLKYKDRRTFN